jgi:hypothetical protein
MEVQMAFNKVPSLPDSGRKEWVLVGKLELRRQVDPPVDRHLDDVWLESEQIFVDKAEERNVGKSRTNSPWIRRRRYKFLPCLEANETLCTFLCRVVTPHRNKETAGNQYENCV